VIADVRVRTLVKARRSESSENAHGLQHHYGRLLANTRRHRAEKLATEDALIATTAAAYELPLITRDRDFANLDNIDAIIV
jgi:predicted nucleic acid-binding protein